MSQRTFDNFDEFATSYRTIHTKNLKLTGADSFYFAEHKVLQLKYTEKDIGIRLLDVGCGDGAVEVFLQMAFPSWQLEGIDITSESIIQAQNRNIPSTNFQSYSGTKIPFGDESFDVVFIAAVLHHIDFSLHASVASEIYRVLKPGGRLYIFEHNPLNPLTNYLVNTCPFDKNAKLLTYGYTEKLLRALPFHSVKRKFILFFPRKGILSWLIWMEKKLGWLPLGGQYYYRAVK